MQAKRIVISGPDGGLGEAVTALLLASGYTLIAAVKDDAAAQMLSKRHPEALGKTLLPVIADLSREEDVAAVFAQAEHPVGIVHLAGGYLAGNTLAKYSVADFDHLIALNTKPTFLMLKYGMPRMQTSGGSIITIGAKTAVHPVEGNAVYTASKAAVIALTLSAAEEGRKSGIRANCIVPAALQTPGNKSWATEAQFNTFTPLKDVADTILFLISDEAKGITGTVLPMYNKIPT